LFSFFLFLGMHEEKKKYSPAVIHTLTCGDAVADAAARGSLI